MSTGAPLIAFRQRFMRGDTLIGTFIKTPTSHTSELLGRVGFDFVVIDEEHAPFDRVTIDAALLGARAAGTAGIVRVAEPSPARLLAALDDGAAGVLVPHVSSPAKAEAIAKACRYRGGNRGFSNSPRAGDYGGVGMAQHIAMQDATVTVIAMIEDPEAIDDIAAIVAVDGIDGLFVGRADLAVALGETAQDAAPVRSATEKVIAAARAAGKPVCIMTGSAAEATDLKALGVSAFIVASDQAFMRQAAVRALTEFAILRG
ncbi:MAG: aldolase/citrate lyase family protein [Pseudolabrys sp.]|nr:aldolase/citrate lyase family protein [Pseudolabrys sp.]